MQPPSTQQHCADFTCTSVLCPGQLSLLNHPTPDFPLSLSSLVQAAAFWGLEIQDEVTSLFRLWWRGCRWLISHWVFTWWKGERSLWSLFYKITNPIQESSAPWSNHLPVTSPSLLILSSHKERISTCELREDVNIQTIVTLFSRKAIAFAFWGPVSTSVLADMSQTVLRSSVLLD